MPCDITILLRPKFSEVTCVMRKVRLELTINLLVVQHYLHISRITCSFSVRFIQTKDYRKGTLYKRYYRHFASQVYFNYNFTLLVKILPYALTKK